MVKDIVEPMFKSNAKTTKTEQDGIQVRMNLDWTSKSDIELDADMMPALVSRLSAHALDSTLIPLHHAGRRKRQAQRQARDIALSFDKCHSSGM